MVSDIRTVLYPLGFLSSLAFGSRFALQWFQSEMKGKSVVSKGFWRLSIIGNILLALHTFIQMQFHVCVVQACCAVLSWRNLNLMQSKKNPVEFRTVIFLLIGTVLFISLAFLLQQYFVCCDQSAWFRIPTVPWQKSQMPKDVSLGWHIVGFVGYVIFSLRFWVQWLSAERSKKSSLSPTFWSLSLIGALLSNIYFLLIGDIVNFIGPAIGMIIYARNLMLGRNKQEASLS